MTRGDVHQTGHVHRPTEQMHRHQCPCGSSDGGLDLIQIDQEGLGVHIHEDRCRSDRTDCFRGGEETEGTGDDFVARPDPDGSQGED